jgi:hypothetical protein
LPVSTEHSLSGSVPDEIARHNPLEAPVLAKEQAMQVPVHAPSQQKPSTQFPLRQSLAAVQASPFSFLPTQVPFEHVFPVRQSPSTVQVVLHAVADAQTRPPAQDVAVEGAQAPALHVPLGTKVVPTGCD